MKTVFFLILSLISLSIQAEINFSQKHECMINEFVSAPYFTDNDGPDIGSIAYVEKNNGKKDLITLNDLVNDVFIYFKKANGEFIEDAYLWLYSGGLIKIPGTNKFYANSVYGDVIITILQNRGAEKIFVKYESVKKGFMFSMGCKPL